MKVTNALLNQTVLADHAIKITPAMRRAVWRTGDRVWSRLPATPPSVIFGMAADRLPREWPRETAERVAEMILFGMDEEAA